MLTPQDENALTGALNAAAVAANATTMSKVLVFCGKALADGAAAIPALEALAALLGHPEVSAGLGIAGEALSVVQSTLAKVSHGSGS